MSESDDPLRVFCELDNETVLDISIGDEGIPDAPVAVPESDGVVFVQSASGGYLADVYIEATVDFRELANRLRDLVDSVAAGEQAADRERAQLRDLPLEIDHLLGGLGLRAAPDLLEPDVPEVVTLEWHCGWRVLLKRRAWLGDLITELYPPTIMIRSAFFSALSRNAIVAQATSSSAGVSRPAAVCRGALGESRFTHGRV